MTHRRHYEENLHYLATHDPLTGLHNRSSFAEQLDQHAELVRRYGSDGALLLLDLDHFKYINDTLGQPPATSSSRASRRCSAGGCARATSSLASAATSSPCCCRARPRRPPQRVAENLLDALRAERIAVPGTGDRTMTASIGVAMFEASDDLRGEDVLVNADLAMYDAKEAGRNQLALHVRGDHAQARMSGRITWAERIRVAIDEDRFTHVAQPIYDLATAG